MSGALRHDELLRLSPIFRACAPCSSGRSESTFSHFRDEAGSAPAFNINDKAIGAAWEIIHKLVTAEMCSVCALCGRFSTFL